MQCNASVGADPQLQSRRDSTRRFFVAFLSSLTLHSLTWAAPPSARQVHFESVEGTVLVVKPDGKVFHASPSTSIELSSFATAIRAVYGHARLRIDDALVDMAESSSLAVRINSQTGAIAIGATSESAGEIRVTVGKAHVTLKPGDAIALVTDPTTKVASIKVLAGTVTVYGQVKEVSATAPETVVVGEEPSGLLLLAPEPGQHEKLDPISPFTPR
ncbi:MAG: hypothetical protein A2992_07055 [Elusimicrobia bacterium RIFCSPLOWO2_01_FULL_59_12]|nr:MAG: hypothetical protein A2992_07055 [Elusimicrobia bacterium RIFCSPLOWO2_01_FULL_59_12]